MEVFLFILSFMSGGVILTVAYTTYLTNSTKTSFFAGTIIRGTKTTI